MQARHPAVCLIACLFTSGERYKVQSHAAHFIFDRHRALYQRTTRSMINRRPIDSQMLGNTEKHVRTFVSKRVSFRFRSRFARDRVPPARMGN